MIMVFELQVTFPVSFRRGESIFGRRLALEVEIPQKMAVTCLHTITFVLLNILSLVETISLKIWETFMTQHTIRNVNPWFFRWRHKANQWFSAKSTWIFRKRFSFGFKTSSMIMCMKTKDYFKILGLDKNACLAPKVLQCGHNLDISWNFCKTNITMICEFRNNRLLLPTIYHSRIIFGSWGEAFRDQKDFGDTNT